jgi:hypothetical protein
MDTELSGEDDSFILIGRAVAEGRMKSRAIVEALDVVEREAARLGARVEGEVVEPLGFERMEEALGRGVVEAVAGAAHAAHDAVAIEELLVVGAAVRPTAIAVVEEPRCGAPPRDGAAQRLEGERLLGPRRRRPPHNATREGIEEDGEEEPALAGAHLRDVGEPQTVGRVGVELALQAVGRGRQIRRGARGDAAEAPRGAAPQPLQAHQPRDAMFAHAVSGGAQDLVDARRSVDVAALSVHGPDPLYQGRVLSLPVAAWAPAPGIEAAPGDLEDMAELAYREGLPVLIDEMELHFWSSAK